MDKWGRTLKQAAGGMNIHISHGKHRCLQGLRNDAGPNHIRLQSQAVPLCTSSPSLVKLKSRMPWQQEHPPSQSSLIRTLSLLQNRMLWQQEHPPSQFSLIRTLWLLLPQTACPPAGYAPAGWPAVVLSSVRSLLIPLLDIFMS